MCHIFITAQRSEVRVGHVTTPCSREGKDLARGPNSSILAVLGIKPLTFRSVTQCQFIKVKQKLDVVVEVHDRNKSSFGQI